MTYNWIGLISAALAFLAFFGTYRRAMKLGIKPRLAWTAPILLLALPGASFAAYYTHLFPEPSWYYEFRSLRAAELFLVPLGAAGGLIASLLPRVALILPLLGVAAFTMTPFLKPIIGPLKSTTLTNVWIENVCIQSTASTCGPASSATILRQLGRETTEAELARDAYTYFGGTEAWYLARAIRSRGYNARFQFSSGLDPKISFPAVAGVKLGTFGHFIAILAKDGDTYHIGDPLHGPEQLSRDALLERYTFTGFYMPISKPESE